MSDSFNRVVTVLEALHSARISSTDVMSLSKEYGVCFYGIAYNLVSARMVYLSLRNRFDLDMSLDVFLGFIPSACDSLDMKYEVLPDANSVTVDSYQHPVADDYQVLLV